MLVPMLIIILLLIYVVGTRNFDYWEKKQIIYCKPLPFFGNCLKKYLQRISPADLLGNIYKNYPKEKYVGYFESNHPALLLRDPEMIKSVLVTDFQTFNAKGINVHQIEPLLNNLFSVEGDLWKLLRQKLSYAFTTAKLKCMFPAILVKAEKTTAIILKQNGAEINVRDLTTRCMTDVITACGFGIDTDCLENDSSDYIKLAQRIFKITIRDAVVNAGKCLAPEIFKHAYVFAPEVENDMTTIFKKLTEAKHGKRCRNNFIDILLSMKEKKKMVGESILEINKDGTRKTVEIDINDQLLIAQAFFLFGAGFETTSATVSFLIHQLAYNPEKQAKCQNEIDAVTDKYVQLSYDAINELKYLEMCIKEALRMYPPLGYYVRVCMKKFTFPNSSLTIDKGVAVVIPVQTLQNDPKYFENPDDFMPERFHPDNLDKMPKHVYIPFGEGPRICIGQRLAFLQVKVCLATILRHCTVVPSANSRRKLISEPTTALVQNVKGGIPLAFVRRKDGSIPKSVELIVKETFS